MVRSGKGQRHFCPVSDSTRPGVLHPGALLLEQHESECICSHKDQPLLMPTACTTTEGCTTLLPWPSEMDRGRSHKPGSHQKRAGGQRKSSPTALLSSRQKNVSWETQKSDGDRAQCSPWGFPLLPATGLWVAISWSSLLYRAAGGGACGSIWSFRTKIPTHSSLQT